MNAVKTRKYITSNIFIYLEEDVSLLTAQRGLK